MNRDGRRDSRPKPGPRLVLELGGLAVVLIIAIVIVAFAEREEAGGERERGGVAGEMASSRRGDGDRFTRMKPASNQVANETDSGRGSPAVNGEQVDRSSPLAKGVDQPSAPPSPPLPPPSDAALRLVAGLIEHGGPEGILDGGATGEWDEQFQRLIGLGDEAVAAIRLFLQGHDDVAFGGGGRGESGIPSARMAMLIALAEIGTPDAVAVMAETLSATAEPLEIAVLAQNLDALAPGQFRQEAINAARQTLELTKAGEIGIRDVAPLFDVLQRFGDGGVVPVLEAAMGQWKYYAATALAGLPDGVGVEALLRMARNDATIAAASDVAVVQSLARVSGRHPDVRAFFIELARSDQLPSRLWPYVAKALTGDRVQFADSIYAEPVEAAHVGEFKATHIESGNQNFYTVPDPANLMPEQIAGQVQFIDELLDVVRDPRARPYFEESRTVMLDRLAGANR